MTADREQIRRDAEASKGDDSFHGISGILARHCLALLDELEQAEKDRDKALAGIIPAGTLLRFRKPEVT